MQLLVAWRERVNASRRAARLTFGDHYAAQIAVNSLIHHGAWWSDDSRQPLDGWREHRFALAGAMLANAFQTVDGSRLRSRTMPNVSVRQVRRQRLALSGRCPVPTS
jgi:hypothetical protein